MHSSLKLQVCLSLMLAFCLPSTAIDCVCLFPTQMSGTVTLQVDNARQFESYLLQVDYRKHLARFHSQWTWGSDGNDYLQDLQNGFMYVFNKYTKECKKVTLSDAWKFPRCVPTGLIKTFDANLNGVPNVTTYRSQTSGSLYHVRTADPCPPTYVTDIKQVGKGGTRTFSFNVHDDYGSDGLDLDFSQNTTGCTEAAFMW